MTPPPEAVLGGCFALLAVMTLAGFLVMGADKRIAVANRDRAAKGRKPRRRVPERTLFLIAALGGSVGVLAGMYLFRHKTKHWSFVLGVPAILAVQLALGWLAVRGLA